jgi:hypothetical protein
VRISSRSHFVDPEISGFWFLVAETRNQKFKR